MHQQFPALTRLCLSFGLALAGAAGAQTWSFSPERDTFSPDALLDLRSLNEKTAGDSGFVRANAEGDLLRGDGTPLRFWAVNSDTVNRMEGPRPLWPLGVPDLDRHARFLAKRGVNMVRLHQQISPALDKTPHAAFTDINPAERDAIWRAVAAFRKQGIYTTLSVYWAVPMQFSASWGIPGGDKQSAFGLLFFDPALQKAYKAWWRALLTEPNPYTGIPLGKDPSVAILQLQNEDSLLFWTVDGIQGPQRQALEHLYADFVARKYGSLDKALSAWRGAGNADDAPQDGRLALLKLWELTQPPRHWPLVGDPRDLLGGKAVRRADQTEFYARTMQRFNTAMVQFLRQDLGAKQLINAGNWRTGSAQYLNDAERWSYTPGDVDAVNAYTGGVHLGPNNGWAIMPGDQFTNESILYTPDKLPLNLKHTQGRPMLVTEGNWVLPNNFGAEGPFLVAAYASLTGVKGYYWFSTGDEGWTPPQSANGYLPSQGKWLFATPEILGSFPAAALAYRLGYIRRGAPVVVEQRSLGDLWQRKAPVIAEETRFDPNRDLGDGSLSTNAGTVAAAQAFEVGPVQVNFNAAPGRPSHIAPLTPWVQPGQITANTTELVWNTTLGYCTVNTPRAQGVVAHFGNAPSHQLRDVRFSSGNEFGAAMAVSMDGEPLRSSHKVLLQFATQSRPNGWREIPSTLPLENGEAASGFTVQSVGQSPWLVQSAQLEVALRNPALHRATVLDMNGMPLQNLPLQRQGDTVSLHFPPHAMYVLLD